MEQPVLNRVATCMLVFAAGYNQVEVAEYLLEHGAEVNAKDKGGLIPLHNASSYGVRTEVSSYCIAPSFHHSPLCYFFWCRLLVVVFVLFVVVSLFRHLFGFYFLFFYFFYFCFCFWCDL